MKRFFLLTIPLFFLAASSAFSQIDTGDYYVSLKIKYGLKKTGIVYDMHIDIGTSKEHPLHGIVSNLDEKIMVKENGSQMVIMNEVDMLSYLKKKGWIISYSTEIKVLGTPYTQYFLTEMNRQ